MKFLKEHIGLIFTCFFFVLNSIALPIALLTENYLQAASNLFFAILFGYVLKMEFEEIQNKNKPKDPIVEDECQ